MKKICHKCGKKKSINDFPKHSGKNGGRDTFCLICKNEANKEHYKKHRKYYIQKAKLRQEKLQLELWKWKSEIGCKFCPERHPACLHFHHRNPEHKLFNIGNKAIMRNRKVIKEELEKCDILCSNCHNKLHFEQKGIKWSV